jgi:hypothetical protein
MENTEFADLIERNINTLVEDWATAVRADASIISSEDLSDGGLRDHVPQVLEEICEVLRTNQVPDVFNTREARVSAYTRFELNYRAQDLAAELSLLRMTLLDCLNESLLNSAKNFRLTDYMKAMRLIHLYIDEEMRYGFSIFSECLKID